MEFISPKDARRISRAITAAEKKTSGEIVAVISASSDHYIFIALMWAALASLLVPLVALPLTNWTPLEVYLLQLAVFAAGALVVQWWPVRIRLVPRAVKRARAHRHAMEQFLAQNLHTTKGRTGVLIFISAAEHYVEVIADEGIYKKAPPETWDRVVEAVTGPVSQGNYPQGFEQAIAICGAILAEHFPPGSADANELPNHLIVLE